MRGMSMLPFGFRVPMSKAWSKISRCVVSSCASTTIARSCSCLARGETESAGACAKTTTGIARAIAQRTLLMAVSFLVLTLATQGDDRVHSGRAPRRDVARHKDNDHEDHRHHYKHFRIKRSNSVEQSRNQRSHHSRQDQADPHSDAGQTRTATHNHSPN